MNWRRLAELLVAQMFTAVVVAGPRQVGKTTLARTSFPDAWEPPKVGLSANGENPPNSLPESGQFRSIRILGGCHRMRLQSRVCVVEKGRKGGKAQKLSKSLQFVKGFVLSCSCSPFDNSGKPCSRWPIATTAFSPLPTLALRFRNADNFLSSSREQPRPGFFAESARGFISIRFGITRRDICSSMRPPVLEQRSLTTSAWRPY